MTRKFNVVTTFHREGYNKYAQKLLQSFSRNWPVEVELLVYAEDCVIDERSPNIVIRDLHQTVPELVAFKNTWKHDPKANGKLAMGPPDRKGKQPGIGFRWDAIRFSHKVYSVCHAAKHSDADVLFWMDADMICHSPMTLGFLEQQIPSDVGLAYLGREKKFSECGLYAMNLNDPITRTWLGEFQKAYDTGRLFQMQEWNDCWVFDETRKEIQATHPSWQQLNWSAGLISGEGHPLINTAWGAYLDHLKGRRKDSGRSHNKDLIIDRREDYWVAAAK